MRLHESSLFIFLTSFHLFSVFDKLLDRFRAEGFANAHSQPKVVHVSSRPPVVGIFSDRAPIVQDFGNHAINVLLSVGRPRQCTQSAEGMLHVSLRPPAVGVFSDRALIVQDS